MKKVILRTFFFGLFSLFTVTLFAQVSVKGTVKSDAGELLPGVSIVVKGTSTGVITNVDGNYTISVPNAQSVLMFSFVGMEPQEVSVDGRSTVDVTLVTTSIGMDEVVVTAMGITKAKKSLAYSVSDVKSEDLVKAGNPNALKSLDGKVSGVNLTSLSSDPTSSVLVNIRGTTVMPSTGDANVSVKGQPLYVIDGIPVGNQTFTSRNGVDFGNILSQLNPEDIETITVLKGGSAGALYGSSGGNGVIMITTKSGKGGKKGIGVSASVSATADNAYNFIEEQQLYGQGERAYEWQYDNTDTWGPKLDGSYEGDYWDTKTQKWDNRAMLSSGENRMEAYLRTGSTVTTNVNVNGNYDKGSFRLSLTNMGNEGVMPNTKTNQTSVTLASDYKLTDKIKVSANANYTRTFSPNKANVTGSNSVLNELLFNLPTNLQPLSEMKNYWLEGYDGILMNGAIMADNGIDVAVRNPWWSTYERINYFTRDNFFGKVQLDWQLSKAFSLMLRSGIDNIAENYEYRQSFGARKLADRSKSGDGQFQANSSNILVVNSDAILSYNQTFGDFTVTANGGFNYAYNNSNSYYINAGALNVPGLFTMANAFPGTLTANYGWGAGKSYSAYGTADIGWKNQLFLGVTGRNDWIGNLEEEEISYFYPSLSAAWVVTETFQLPEMFDLVKARYGYADVGNGLVRQRNVDTYTFESPDWSGTVKTANINAALVDPDIKPMHSITNEFGVDAWMFQKRILFDFTYFIKDQVDQLGGIPVVQGTGFTSMTTNIGDVRNEGYEWGLTVNPVRTTDWNWDLTGTFTHYKATITRLSENFAPNGYVFASYGGKAKVKIAEGEEIGNIYEENPVLKVKTGKYAGVPLLDNDGKVQRSSDERDRAQLANFNPDYIIGLNTTVRYKRWSLNMVGSFRVGGDYISQNQQYMDSNGRSWESVSSGDNNPWWKGGRDESQGGMAWPAAGASKYPEMNGYNDDIRSDFHDASYAKGVWLIPGSDPNNDASYIVNGADPNNTFYDFPYNGFGDVIWNFTSTRVYDATNFKLREVSLNYNLPTAWTNKIKINNANIAFIGRNLFQWNASGRNEDPETAFDGTGTSQGILRATLPPVRSLGFKLALDF